MSDNEAKYGPILRAAFVAEGLPGEWGMAISKWETGGTFDPNTVATDPRDLARGGSYGLCQMSLRTAQALGFQGDAKLLLDPWLNAHYAAALCAQNQRIVGSDLARVAAAYNCGCEHVLQGTVPADTASLYVPHVVRYAAEYAAQFASEDQSTVPSTSTQEQA